MAKDLISIKSPADILKQRAAAENLDNVITEEETLTGLEGHIREVFERNKKTKLSIQEELLILQRQKLGKYETEERAAIDEFGGSDIFVMLTAAKCREFEAWVKLILNPTLGQSWDIEPTPIPDLDEETTKKIEEQVHQQVLAEAVMYNKMSQQAVPIHEYEDRATEQLEEEKEKILKAKLDEASERAENMKQLILDQLDEGNFKEALNEVISDMGVFKSGILKGPIIRMKPQITYKKKGKKSVPVVENKPTFEFERVDPLQFYPEGDMSDINYGSTIEIQRITPSQLLQLKGVDGFNAEKIDQVLNQYGETGVKEYSALAFQQAANIGQELAYSISHKIDMLEFWGSVKGKHLITWGMTSYKDVSGTKMDIDEDCEYNICAWSVKGIVIKAMINPDPLGNKPYFITGCFKVPGTIWHQSIAEVISDIQRQCNNLQRAIANNAAFASGPQIEADVSRMESSREDNNEIYPLKVWFTNTGEHSNRNYNPVIQFFQPALVADRLQQIYNQLKQEADEKSGIPSFSQNVLGGAGGNETASGLAILRSDALRNILDIVTNIDTDIVTKLIKKLYNYNMLYWEDESVKGDLNVVVKGVKNVMAKEQLVIRRNEFFNLLANPVIAQTIKPEDMKTLVKEQVKDLDFPGVDKMFESDEDTPPQQQAPAPATPGGMPPLPAATNTGPAGQPMGGAAANQFANQ